MADPGSDDGRRIGGGVCRHQVVQHDPDLVAGGSHDSRCTRRRTITILRSIWHIYSHVLYINSAGNNTQDDLEPSCRVAL